MIVCIPDILTAEEIKKSARRRRSYPSCRVQKPRATVPSA